jgi:hypothetical protein
MTQFYAQIPDPLIDHLPALLADASELSTRSQAELLRLMARFEAYSLFA